MEVESELAGKGPDFPNLTSQEGIFVAGTASGPMDIVDSILTAGSAAIEASAYLKTLQGNHAANAGERISERKELIHA